ncbi:MAG TPA: hypothetical protein VKM55_29200 [Candidatus Lokiarchaeia archaeon]|nr:hypothetical protein [Candidatus Lokiarchaeia archaeon]
MSDNFDSSVFNVKDPVCAKCRSSVLDFKLYENYNGAGTDWLQWFCTNHCGYFINVEIV